MNTEMWNMAFVYTHWCDLLCRGVSHSQCSECYNMPWKHNGNTINLEFEQDSYLAETCNLWIQAHSSFPSGMHYIRFRWGKDEVVPSVWVTGTQSHIWPEWFVNGQESTQRGIDCVRRKNPRTKAPGCGIGEVINTAVLLQGSPIVFIQSVTGKRAAIVQGVGAVNQRECTGHTDTHTHTHTHMRAHTHAPTHSRTHTHKLTQESKHTQREHLHTDTNRGGQTHTHRHTHTHSYICTHTASFHINYKCKMEYMWTLSRRKSEGQNERTCPFHIQTHQWRPIHHTHALLLSPLMFFLCVCVCVCWVTEPLCNLFESVAHQCGLRTGCWVQNLGPYKRPQMWRNDGAT